MDEKKVGVIENPRKRRLARHKTLDEYWEYRSKNDYRPDPKDGKGCAWCEKFKPLDFRVCMNCGILLGGKGAF